MDLKYLAPVAAVLLGAFTAFSSNFGGLIAAHPQWAGGLGALGTLLAAFAPQPHR